MDFNYIISWMNCTIAKYRWTGFFCVSRAFCIVCFRSLGLIVSHTGAPRECLRCRLSSLNFFQDLQNCCNFTSQMTRIRAVQFSHSEDGSLTAPYIVVPLFKNLIPLLTSPFYRAMLAQSAVMRLHVVCLSVRPSVTIRYRDHIRWNCSKIISRPNSLRSLLWLTPNIGDLMQREHPQN